MAGALPERERDAVNAPADLAHRDALLQSARALRSQGGPAQALTVLDRLEASHPRFSRLFQERGHCHVELRNAPAAIAALQEAVRLNPTLPASWDMLEQLYRLMGDTAQAAEAGRRLAVLQMLPPEVVMANCLLVDGDLDPAADVIEDFLRKDPDNVGGLRLLARVRLEAGAAEAAEQALRKALERAPEDEAARYDLVMALLRQEKYALARREAERLIARDPNHRDYLKQYGLACIGLGDYEPTIALYARLLSSPDISGTEIADLRFWRANALKTVGRLPEAIADYRASLAARPDYGVAWFSLANLKTYRFSEDDIARMQTAEARSDTQEMDRIYLNFALGKAFEDLGDYETSWRFYETGNALRRRTSTDCPEIADAFAAGLRKVFTRAFFSERKGWGAEDPTPIFILGLPRSGSTLIEQILASHSQVEGTHELTEMDRMVCQHAGRDPNNHLPRDIDVLAGLSAADVGALGQRFLEETSVYRRLGRPYFIDKMPNNFWHVGFIHMILPNARIIDIRREPMSCGFSNLKQLYSGANQEFSYGVESFARRYRTYLDVMRTWDEVLPGRVLRVSYEDVVEDLERGVLRILDHCGLSFEAQCLAFHQTQRSVRTPSSEQVRQPIGRQGVDQWRHYAPWLAPLREALGDAVTRYRD